jgi:hypothetical protein
MNSRLLMGFHAGMQAAVEVDTGEFGKAVSQPETDEYPVFEGGAQFVFALPQAGSKGNHSREPRDLTRKGAVVELVVGGKLKSGFDIGGQRAMHGLKIAGV